MDGRDLQIDVNPVAGQFVLSDAGVSALADLLLSMPDEEPGDVKKTAEKDV